MKRREFVLTTLTLTALPFARAHHGWSSFDQERVFYLQGKAARVRWQNPHAELELEVDAGMKLPPDLANRALPPQSASVDGKALASKAQLPARKDRKWTIELAPLTRMEAWNVVEIKPGTEVSVLGFALREAGAPAVLRAEYLFVDGKVYGLRSSPA